MGSQDEGARSQKPEVRSWPRSVGVALEEVQNREEALRWLGFVGLEQKANEAAGELRISSG